jgi:hypothetical protein
MSSIVLPPTHANSFVIGTAVINTHTGEISPYFLLRAERARQSCAASITPSASSKLTEGLACAYAAALQLPACPLDPCARQNCQVRVSPHTLHAATRQVTASEQLGPSYFFISLVLGPLNSLVWWEVPLGYIALG